MATEEIRLNGSRADVVASVGFHFRLHGSRIVTGLVSNKGQLHKSCTKMWSAGSIFSEFGVEVTAPVAKECKSKDGTVSREMRKVRLLDDSNIDCDIALWGALRSKVTLMMLARCYRLKLSVWESNRSLSSVEETFIQRIAEPDHVSTREDKIMEKLRC